MDNAGKRGVCWAATVSLAIGYLYSATAHRFNFPSLAPISTERLRAAAALAFVLTLVYESDGLKAFARAPVLEGYHDEYHHYPLLMIIAAVLCAVTMQPVPSRPGLLNQHQTEGIYSIIGICVVVRVAYLVGVSVGYSVDWSVSEFRRSNRSPTVLEVKGLLQVR